jgi:hypothetical protein
MRPGRDALNVSTRPNLKPWIAAMAKDGRKFNTPRSTAKARATRAAIRQALSVSYEVGRAEWLSGRVPMLPMPMMPAPWAEKSQHSASTKAKIRKEGPKERRVNLIARDFWPPDGKPPASLTNPEIVKKVGDAYQKRYGQTVDRTTILRSRTINRLPRLPHR